MSSPGGPPSLPLPGPVERGGEQGAVVRSGAGSPAPLLRVSLPVVSAQCPQPEACVWAWGPWFLSPSEPRASPSSLRLFFPSILAELTAIPREEPSPCGHFLDLEPSHGPGRCLARDLVRGLCECIVPGLHCLGVYADVGVQLAAVDWFGGGCGYAARPRGCFRFPTKALCSCRPFPFYLSSPWVSYIETLVQCFSLF